MRLLIALIFLCGSLKGATDIYYSSVSSLIQFNGVDAQTTGTDDKTGTTLTFNNGAALSTTAPPVGMNTSVVMDGSNNFVNFTDAGQYDLGTADFTIEWWMNAAAVAAGDNAIAGNYLGSDTNKGWTLIVNGTTGAKIVRANNVVTTKALTLTTGSWYAGCLCKTSANSQFFINGATLGTSFADANSYTPDTNVSPSIGRISVADGGYWNGNLGPIRITKGFCRYPANYTVPDLPLPTSGETQLSPYMKNSNRTRITPPRLLMWLMPSQLHAMSSDSRQESQRNQAAYKLERDVYTKQKFIADVTAKTIVTATPTLEPKVTATRTPTPKAK